MEPLWKNISGIIRLQSRSVRIAWLTRQLNSPIESEAKKGAALLDRLLYPNYGRGLVTAAESERISREHFGALRGSNVIDPLLETLVNGTSFARAYVAAALGAIEDRRALSLLVSALSDPVPTVREAASQGLMYFGEPSTVSALVRLLEDPVPEVRRTAAWTLGFIRSAEAVPALIGFYERGDREDRVRALWALGFICDPTALPFVRSALFDKVRKVRRAAQFALAQYDRKRRDSA